METETIKIATLIEHQTRTERVNRQAWMTPRDDALESNLQAVRARTTGKPTMLVTLRHLMKGFRPANVRP